jgi:anti-anti-sigma factor
MGIDFKLNQQPVEGKPNVTLFELSGWLDARSEASLVEAVQKAKDQGTAYVLLDLRGIETITSAGIRAIQQAFQLLTPKEEAHKIVHLKLCNASPPIYEVLSITGLLQSVPMYESRSDAIDSFGK